MGMVGKTVTTGFAVRFREGTGKAIALYTHAPDMICAMAELKFLFEKVPDNGKPVLGYADVNTSLSRDIWFGSYKGNDLRRLLEIVEEIQSA